LERRQFLGACAALSGAGGLSTLPARADTATRFYERAELVDAYRNPLRVRELKDETNYVFQYPYSAQPCFCSSCGTRSRRQRR
jgi:hypothetical protein